jgi:hypothetical protein
MTQAIYTNTMIPMIAWDKIMITCQYFDVTFDELTKVSIRGWSQATLNIRYAKYVCAFYLYDNHRITIGNIIYLFGVSPSFSDNFYKSLENNCILNFYTKLIDPTFSYTF